MAGPDRLTWLDSLTTQAVRTLAPGESAELMILSPQGRIEHVAALVDDGETAWLITETASGLAAFLDRMRFMLRVEVADVTSEWAALGEAVDRPAAAGEPVTWLDPWPGVTAGGTSYSVGQAGRALKPAMVGFSLRAMTGSRTPKRTSTAVESSTPMSESKPMS